MYAWGEVGVCSRGTIDPTRWRQFLLQNMFDGVSATRQACMLYRKQRVAWNCAGCAIAKRLGS